MSNESPLEKNYVLALVLCLLVLFSYPFFLKWVSPPAETPMEEVKAVLAGTTSPTGLAESVLSPTTLSPAEGPFLEQPVQPTIVDFKNANYEIRFSTLGGTVTRLAYRGEPSEAVSGTLFFEGETNRSGLFGLTLLHEQTDLSQMQFKLNRRDEDRDFFEFVYEKPGDFRLTKGFYFSSKDPVIGMEVGIENLSGRERHFPLELTYGLDTSSEEGRKDSMPEAVAFTDKVKTANIGKVTKKGFTLSEEILWVGAFKKYFTILIKPPWKAIDLRVTAKDNLFWGRLRMEPVTLASGEKKSGEFFIYAGPQRYETLKSYDVGFENVLSRGIFGIFKIWLLKGLKFTNGFTHNYGWAIIIVTLLLKGLFAPLTHMSYKSMEKMKVLQPKTKALQERYKSDPQKLNKEMMELYKKHRVNPMGGCLPMLLQIPVFIAFYQVLNEAIELNGTPFIWWITDLAKPDTLFTFPMTLPLLGDGFHFLPLLMIGSMFWQQKLTPQVGTNPEQQKIFAFMPLIFGFIFYKMPSGLVLYWFVNNVLSIIQQVFVKRLAGAVLHHDEHE